MLCESGFMKLEEAPVPDDDIFLWDPPWRSPSIRQSMIYGFVERSFPPMELTLITTISDGITNWSQADFKSSSSASSRIPFSTGYLIRSGLRFPPAEASPVATFTTSSGYLLGRDSNFRGRILISSMFVLISEGFVSLGLRSSTFSYAGN